MKLRVIGAGLPRTGTSSLRLALEQLLGGRCYHMSAIPGHPYQLGKDWDAALAGKRPDWNAVFDGYIAAVDWPVSMFWRELSQENPATPVLLSVRESAAKWLESANATILPTARKALAPDWTGGRDLVTLLERFTGTDQWDDPATLMAAYDRHNEAVRAAIPPHAPCRVAPFAGLAAHLPRPRIAGAETALSLGEPEKRVGLTAPRVRVQSSSSHPRSRSPALVWLPILLLQPDSPCLTSHRSPSPDAKPAARPIVYWADLIRVVAIFLVVVVHISGQLTNVWGKVSLDAVAHRRCIWRHRPHLGAALLHDQRIPAVAAQREPAQLLHPAHAEDCHPLHSLVGHLSGPGLRRQRGHVYARIPVALSSCLSAPISTFGSCTPSPAFISSCPCCA